MPTSAASFVASQASSPLDLAAHLPLKYTETARRIASATFSRWFCLALLLSVGQPLIAQDNPLEPEFSGYGTGGNRDKTRVFGTIYDSQGNPLAQSDVRIKNDRAPADEVRARSRKTGTYLARSLGKLYTERDVEGIMIRARFERDGYEPTEIVAGVERNNGIEINPILWKPGEDPASMTQWSVVITGKVLNAKGKKQKGAIYVLTSPSDASFRREGAAEKDGSFRELVWAGPNSFVLEVSADGATKSVSFRVEGAPRTNVVSELRHEIRLDSR